MLRELRPAIMLLLFMSVITGLIYPLIVTGVAQTVFPHQAAGSLIKQDGKIVGSGLIGQNFTSDKYFHGRPSAITSTDAQNVSTPDPYDPTSSSGSNLGPTSQALIDRMTADSKTLSATGSGQIPVDLITSSASGLDPDITPAAAEFQAPRVAQARGITVQQVRNLIAASTEERTLGIIGEPRVNVLLLNQKLDIK